MLFPQFFTWLAHSWLIFQVRSNVTSSERSSPTTLSKSNQDWTYTHPVTSIYISSGLFIYFLAFKLFNNNVVFIIILIPIYDCYVQLLFSNLFNPHPVWGIIFIHKLKNWDMKGHTASVWQNWISNPSIPTPEFTLINTKLYSLSVLLILYCW